jgi:predicted DNA-binding transcriptional regulator YafY
VTERRIEPFRLVCTGRRWYLVARDVEQIADADGGWRTFRVDRVMELAPTGHRFHRADAPDPAEFVRRAITRGPVEQPVRVRFPVSAEQLATTIPPWVGTIAPAGPDASTLATATDNPFHLAAHLLGTGLAFEVVEPRELRARMHELGRDLAARHQSPA